MAPAKNQSIHVGQAFVGGSFAAAAMLVTMFVASKLGLPMMNPVNMLARMARSSDSTGWVLHFVLGVAIALPFALGGRDRIKVASDHLAGALYGAIVFIGALLLMMVVRAVGLADASESPLSMIIGGLVGHLIYGVVLGAFVRRSRVA